MKSPARARFFRPLIIILISAALSSCSGGSSGSSEQEDGSDQSSVAIIASVSEGFAPLEVTFSVVENGTNVKSVFWDFGDGQSLSAGDGPVTHTFSASGDYSVSASLDTTNSATPVIRTSSITVFKNVNLVVSSFAIDDALTPGSLETISAIIQNIGTDSLDSEGVYIDVGYYLSTDENITVDDIYIGDTSIQIGTFFTQSDIQFGFQELAPGENYQFDHQLAVKGNVPAGTYYAGAIVDYVHEFDWYTFPRSTDTREYSFPVHVVVPESNENDNVRLLPAHQVTVSAETCVDDAYESDNSSMEATVISVGQTQVHNFCFDNSDWLQFDAVEGGVYKITTFDLGLETDTQLILYDKDASSILLFHDNLGNVEAETKTVDLESDFPPRPESEIVWEAQSAGTYYIRVRTTACDEDLDDHCETKNPSMAPEGIGSPDGVGLDTEYSISLQ